MKEYIRTFKELIRVSKDEILMYSVVSLIGAIIGAVMVLIIMAVEGSGEDYGEMGSMFSMLIGVIALIFGGIYGTSNDFNMAISMGKTRKHFVPAKYAMLVIETAIIVLIAGLTGMLEGSLYTAIYPNAVCELKVSAWVAQPFSVCAVIFGVPAIIMLLGALLMVYGQKFFWVIWALWMFGCMGVPRIISATSESPESFFGKLGIAITDFITGLPKSGLAVGICGIIVVILLVNARLLCKQRVTA